MDPVEQERLRRGIAALRSGEFEQAQGALRLPDVETHDVPYRYCCLGVLTEVAVRDGLELEEGLCACGRKFHQEHEEDLAEMETDPDLSEEDICAKVTNVWEFSSGVLSYPVMAWYGFGMNDPIIGALNDQSLQASVANDDQGWDFNQIADGFEATYLNVEPE